MNFHYPQEWDFKKPTAPKGARHQMKKSKTFRLDEKVTDKLEKKAKKQNRSEANVVETELAEKWNIKI